MFMSRSSSTVHDPFFRPASQQQSWTPRDPSLDSLAILKTKCIQSADKAYLFCYDGSDLIGSQSPLLTPSIQQAELIALR